MFRKPCIIFSISFSFHIISKNSKYLVLHTIYLISVMSPFLVAFFPSKNSTLKVYAYTSMGCTTPLNFPSHPMFTSFVSNTFCPQRFQIINCNLVIPNPFTKTLLFMSLLCGVNALGTSTASDDQSTYLLACSIRTSCCINCNKTSIVSTRCIILVRHGQP